METLFYLEDGDFWESCFADLKSCPDVRIIKKSERFSIKEKALKMFCKAHNSIKLNVIMRIPFKTIWLRYDQIYQYMRRKPCKFVITDTLIREYDFETLQRYKATGSQLYLLFLNPILNDLHTQQAFTLSKSGIFDKVFTIDFQDAERYGFEYTYHVCSSTQREPVPITRDIFFVGNAKNRLCLLEDIADAVKNVRSAFYISGVSADQIKDRDNIIYNEYLSYPKVLDMVLESRCILEVMQKNQTGVTYRTYEAISYNKKLLTNNPEIKRFPFYDERYIYYFEQFDEEAVNFILKDTKVDYGYKGEFSPVHLVKKLKPKEA